MRVTSDVLEPPTERMIVIVMVDVIVMVEVVVDSASTSWGVMRKKSAVRKVRKRILDGSANGYRC